MNGKMLNFLKILGIKTKATSAFSPFENGIVERHNGVIKITMTKLNADYRTLADDMTRINMVLHRAIFAKNSMMNLNGYSPFLRTFGVDVSIIPSIETESVVITDVWVKEQMDAVHKVRKAFLEAESDQRIKAAMNRKADPYHIPLPIGSQAMYYRDGKKGEKGWHGPGKIIDRDGSEYTIKHGRNLLSIHKRDIRKFRSSVEFENDEMTMKKKNEQVLMRNDEEIDCEANLINKNEQESKMTKCERSGDVTTCMRILTEKTCHAQRHKPSKSIEEIAKNIFKYSFVCAECLFVNQRQLVINHLLSCGISDNNLKDCINIMDATPRKWTRHEFKIRTGEIAKDVAKGFLITTQQYGFAVEELNNLGSRRQRTTLQLTTEQSNQSSSATSDGETSQDD